MNRKILAQAICCALVTLSVPISSSFAASWTPQLLAPASGDFRKGSEPVRIQILGLPANVAKTLTFEVDDIDVTSVVKQRGDVFTFTPTQAMAKGGHTIRVVENAADGSIIERGIWKIDIRKSRGLREASGALNATVTYTRRVNDDGLNGPDIPDKNQGTGSFQFSGAAANDNWRLKANVDIVYNSQADQTQRQHAWDIAQFLFTHSVGAVETNIGRHAIAAPDSLIVQSLNRRGVSVRYRKPETGFNFGGFAIRGSEVIGATGGFGAGDPNNRISGLSLTARPLRSNRNKLEISSTAVSGQGSEAGDAAGGDLTVVSGSAANFVADANFLKQKLRIRSEIAATRFDADGPGNALKEESDNAHALLLQYTPWLDKQIKGKAFGLQFGFENKRMGTFFRSMANLSAISDKDLNRAFLQLNWSGLDFQASLGKEKDNVNDIAGLGQSETTQTVLNITFAPEQKYKKDGAPTTKWWGQPNYSLAYFKSDQKVIKASPVLALGKLTSTSNLEGTAAFTYNTWDWSVSLSKGKEEDFTGNNPDTETDGINLNANFRIGEKLTLSPTLQISTVADQATGIDTDTTVAGLTVGYIINSKVNTSFTYNLNRDEAGTDGIIAAIDRETTDYTIAVNWVVKTPKENRPGFTLSLQGSRNEVDDGIDPTQSTDTTQIFLTATIGWNARTK
ncbi:MAG: hypothetical protein BMS9Abin11_1426 [Gammaproteobacteria bacterium]|nr:MAG: hypothetical protein BMS9Abin11_1426 [Gammaproteobacteria bacterium]